MVDLIARAGAAALRRSRAGVGALKFGAGRSRSWYRSRIWQAQGECDKGYCR